MRNRFLIIRNLLSPVAFLYLVSCAPAYVPNTINTPLLSNKGEIQAGLNYGLSGFDPQAAYALTDHIGLMINGSFRNNTSDSSDSYHRHAFVEGGGGYYTRIGGAGRFEVYGGYGYSRLQAYFDGDIWIKYANVYSHRLFLQPAVGFTTKVFDLSFASRVVLVSMHQEDVQENVFLFEPALTLKLGYKYVKGVVQFGLSFPNSSVSVDFGYQPIMFSIGVQADLRKNYDL
jgi:hypothetical protein